MKIIVKLIELSKTVKIILNLIIIKSVFLGKKSVSLKCNLSIFFHFTSEDYSGNIKFEKCIDSNFKDCEINLYLPKKEVSKLRVYKSLSHELTHLYELYQVKDVFDKSSWIKSSKLNIFDKLEYDGLMKYFRDVFYASLPHEIRANLSSLEVFLIGLRSKDEVYLRSELDKTSEWSRYKAISEFNIDIYLSDLINEYGLSFTIRVFNLFNKILEIKSNEIKSEMDLIKYFKNWKKYFSDISKDYKYKIDKKIKEIIEKNNDISDRYVLEKYEDTILTYSDYLNNISYSRDIKLDDLLKIDYLSYFVTTNLN